MDLCKQLAEQTGLHKSTVRKVLNGDCVPKLTTLQSLADKLGHSLPEFVEKLAAGQYKQKQRIKKDTSKNAN